MKSHKCLISFLPTLLLASFPSSTDAFFQEVNIDPLHETIPLSPLQVALLGPIILALAILSTFSYLPLRLSGPDIAGVFGLRPTVAPVGRSISHSLIPDGDAVTIISNAEGNRQQISNWPLGLLDDKQSRIYGPDNLQWLISRDDQMLASAGEAPLETASPGSGFLQFISRLGPEGAIEEFQQLENLSVGDLVSSPDFFRMLWLSQALVTSDWKSCLGEMICEVDMANRRYNNPLRTNNVDPISYADDDDDLENSRSVFGKRDCSQEYKKCGFNFRNMAGSLIQTKWW